jgi:hypothetical protein
MANQIREQMSSQEDHPEGRPHRIRLPGFLIEDDTGLGDLVKKATYAMGIKTCGGCEKRAQALNRWVVTSR